MSNYRRTKEQEMNEPPVFNMSGSFERGYVQFHFKRARSLKIFICNIPTQMSISNMIENLSFYVEQQFQMNSFEIVSSGQPLFGHRRPEDAHPILINDTPVITLCKPGKKTQHFYVRPVSEIDNSCETGQCMVCFIENIPIYSLRRNYRCADNALHYLCSGCLYHCNSRQFLSNVCPLCRAECAIP